MRGFMATALALLLIGSVSMQPAVAAQPRSEVAAPLVDGPPLVVLGTALCVVGLVLGLEFRANAIGAYHDAWGAKHEAGSYDEPVLEWGSYADIERRYTSSRNMAAVGFALAGVGAVGIGVGIPVWIRSSSARNTVAVNVRWRAASCGAQVGAVTVSGRW